MGQMDALWNFYRSSVQVGDDHVQLQMPQEKKTKVHVRDTSGTRQGHVMDTSADQGVL